MGTRPLVVPLTLGRRIFGLGVIHARRTRGAKRWSRGPWLGPRCYGRTSTVIVELFYHASFLYADDPTGLLDSRRFLVGGRPLIPLVPGRFRLPRSFRRPPIALSSPFSPVHRPGEG